MTVLKTTAVPADLGGSGWYEILPKAREYPPLASEIHAEWLVVGAGFAGLAAAMRLARHAPGDRIVVLDAQRIAWGAAGRNSGFMIDLPHELNSENYTGARQKDFQQIAQNRVAIEFVRAAAEEFGLDSQLSPIGKIHGAADETGVRALGRFSRHLTGLGERWSSLDHDDMRRITGSAFFRGGIHTPGALLIQPAAYIVGLAQGLSERYGVTIHEQTPVLELSTGTIPVARTPKGSVTAPRVILAVNGHIESLGLFKHRLMHIFTYASMTRALSKDEQGRLGGESEWGLIPAHPMGSTLRRLRCARLLVRNTFTWNPDMRTGEDQVRKVGRVHLRSFEARFPMLPNVEMEYRWGGHLCLSRNSVPAFGEVAEGVFAAACQNGLGTTKGTLSGMLAADLACGVSSETLRQWRSQDAPQNLLPEPLMSLGARAYLRWVQHRAGLDL